MTSAALNNLWQYINGLSLTPGNKRWLAQKLIEPQSELKSFNSKTKAAIAEIENGEVTVCNTWEEFLDAVK